MRLLAIGCVVVLVAGVGSTQEPKNSQTLKRAIHVLEHRAAKDVAKLLTAQFKSEAEVTILADAPSNCVLLQSPPKLLEQLLENVAQLDRAPRAVLIDVWVAELKSEGGKNAEDRGLTGPLIEVETKLKALQKKGVVVSIGHVQIRGLEHQPTTCQSGEERSIVTSAVANRAAAGGLVTSLDRRVVGTLVTATARVAAEQVVHIDLTFEDSRPRLATDEPPLAIDADGTPVHGTTMIVSRLETHLGIPAGQALLLQNLKTHGVAVKPRVRGREKEEKSEPRPDQVLVIVGARLAGIPSHVPMPKDK